MPQCRAVLGKKNFSRIKASSAKIIVSAVLTVFRVPGVRQIDPLARRNMPKAIGILRKFPAVVDQINYSHKNLRNRSFLFILDRIDENYATKRRHPWTKYPCNSVFPSAEILGSLSIFTSFYKIFILKSFQGVAIKQVAPRKLLIFYIAKAAFCFFYRFWSGELFKRFHNVIAEGFAGCAALSSCDDEPLFLEGADIERALESVGSVLISDMRKKHYAGAKHR